MLQRPSKRNRTGPIAALVEVLITAPTFGAWWFLGRDNQQTTDPSATATTTQVPSQTPSSTDPTYDKTLKSTSPASKTGIPRSTKTSGNDSNGSGMPPEIPKSLNGFEALSLSKVLTLYLGRSDIFSVLYIRGGAMAEGATRTLENPEIFGRWTCGMTTRIGNSPIPASGIPCITAAHGGVVIASMGLNGKAPEIAEDNKAFLEAWK